MVNLLPAIVIGGPPHAGKSALFYSLTSALHERGIPHHAIRACPDGEGNWSQESDQTVVSNIRQNAKIWPEHFVQRICQNLEHRHLPLLVDVGGKPQGSQMNIFRFCTHAILLLRADQPDEAQRWQRIMADCDLLPLAEVYSQLDGVSRPTTQSPIIQGTIGGLERGKAIPPNDAIFSVLLESVASLFNAYNPQELERIIFEQAPSELLDIANHWEVEMLAPLLDGLPMQTSFSAYGRAPGWVYAALAVHSDPQLFYQFDPLIGWVQPLTVEFGEKESPEVQIRYYPVQGATVLTITIPSKRLVYFQPDPLSFPTFPTDRGLIIDGVMPHWLLTALVRLYKQAGMPWLAFHYVQKKGAIVVYSRDPSYAPGDLIPFSAAQNNI